MKELKVIEKTLSKRKQPKNSAKSVEEWELLEFKRRLNQPPPDNILRANPEYGNKYIPMQFQEVMLNILFDYWYPVMRHKPDYVEGNTVFYMDVIVMHPILKTEMCYSGTAVVGTMPNSQNYRDVHKRLPAGESFAILNATQKIGRIFRPQAETFISALDNYFEKEQQKEKREVVKRLERMITSLDFTRRVNISKAIKWLREARDKEEITEDEFNYLDGVLTKLV